MVHFSSSGGRKRPVVGDKVGVKPGTADSLEDQHPPFNKKQKQFPAPDQVATRKTVFEVTPSQYNPLEEPSPLGLRLRKSPSLLELIQMRLTESGSIQGPVPTDNSNSLEKGNTKGSAQSGATDKLKASNFPAALLRIGSWEYISRYEGDLVAKCYFAKHKLVWEILDGSLKSKIEIQWSDIMGLRADLPENAPATLVVALARKPLFYRETNPQPRKHTLWQASTDFTDGQASMHRKHFLRIPHGLLNKHFEKLVQCDMRLNFLSQQPDIIMDSPYFENQPSVLNDSDSKIHGYQIDINKKARTSIFEDIATHSVAQSSSITTKQDDHRTLEIVSQDSPSSSSEVTDMCAVEGSSSAKINRTKSFEQLVMQGLRPSMSKTDLVNHIGNCFSENQTLEKGPESRKMLEEIAQHLLGDFQFTTPSSDEKSLLSRVNSLYSLLQNDDEKDTETDTHKDETIAPENFKIPDGKDAKTDPHKQASKDETLASRNDGGFMHSLGTMPRIDSYGDLLLNLPRIASLPKFLFDIPEDGDNQFR